MGPLHKSLEFALWHGEVLADGRKILCRRPLWAFCQLLTKLFFQLHSQQSWPPEPPHAFPAHLYISFRMTQSQQAERPERSQKRERVRSIQSAQCDPFI